MDDEVVAALDAEQGALARMVAPLDRSGMLAGSRCEGWTVADVLVHLAQTNEFAAASVGGRFSEAVEAGPDVTGVGNVDEWAAAALEAERAQDPLDARSRWEAGAAAQIAAFEQCDAAARVPWVVGEMAARTLASTRLSETWIHSCDIAAALGITPEPTGRLWHIARLAHRTIPYAFMLAEAEPAGDVAFRLEAPDGSRWSFGDVTNAATVITGPALQLCEVAGQRADAGDTDLRGEGPDAARTLELVRTFA